jgi:predicted TIM-barrel fold metal-dependent hydrolase
MNCNANTIHTKSEIAKRFTLGLPLDHIPIVDFHSHLGSSSEYYYIPRSSPASVVNCMDRFGIDHLVTFSLNSTSDQNVGNRFQYQAAESYPQRFSTLTALHAQFPQDWLACLEEGARRGSRGIKLISQYQHVREEDIDWTPAFEFAKDRKWVILHHWWSSAERLERFARDYPGMTFIIGHADISFKKIIEKYDNVFQCTCACFVPPFFATMKQMVDALPAEKILYGSDALDLDFATGIGPIALGDFAEKTKEMILGGNARKLIKKLGWNIDLTQ